MTRRAIRQRKRRKKKAASSSNELRPIFAMDLAESYIRHYRVDEAEEREFAVGTILALGGYLAASVGPLAWDALVVEDLLLALEGLSPWDIARTAYIMVGFYQLLVLEGVIRGRSARRVFREMQRVWPANETNRSLLKSALSAVEVLIGLEGFDGKCDDCQTGDGECESIAFIDLLEMDLSAEGNPPN